MLEQEQLDRENVEDELLRNRKKKEKTFPTTLPAPLGGLV